MGHRAKSAAYVMPSGRLDITKDNAKSIRSIRAMVVTPIDEPGVSGALAAMTTYRDRRRGGFLQVELH